MKKIGTRRILIGLGHNLIAALFAVILADTLFHSYINIDTVNGKKLYEMNLFSEESEFEDTEVFSDLFENSVSDIIRFVAMKAYMEEDGQFSPHKVIDINHFYLFSETENKTSTMVNYELDDLIKWGLSGIEFTTRHLSVHDFVNYFGNVLVPENFAIGKDKRLYFKGFNWVVSSSEESNLLFLDAIRDLANDPYLMRDDLEQMVLNYVIANSSEDISVTKEEDGNYTVHVKMINNRYLTMDDKKFLYDKTQNWISYMDMQNRLIKVIEALSNNYSIYQNCKELYDYSPSNLKYTVRMMTEVGEKTYTNYSDIINLFEEELTEIYSEYRRYLIYYPDNLDFMGNTTMTENEIYNALLQYDFAFPEYTHIWIGVDTNYPEKGDTFYNANKIFQRLSPTRSFFLVAAFLLVGGWILILLYMTITAGTYYDEAGNKKYHLNQFDHIWTEVFLALLAVYGYGIYLAVQFLTDITRNVHNSFVIFSEGYWERMFPYLYFAGVTAAICMIGSLLWYSLVRRCKAGSVWRDSFIYKIVYGARDAFYYATGHKNVIISIVLPYLIVLLGNIICIFGIILLPDLRLLSILAMLVIDGLIGIYLFQDHADKTDIIDAIHRIREGDVEYKLDVSKLHGNNIDTGEAVNTIGEGIKNAVRTSIKDEQMKTDLITNVSHDLKTPLTSIVSYVDLLKRMNIDNEQARSYIDILDTKANRLKQLTDDLVEVSKISSGNIVLNMERLNLDELMNQAIGEFVDILEEHHIEIVYKNHCEDSFIYADSRRLWRVVENLFNNVKKYAVEGTRVFVDLNLTEDHIVELSMKNVSNHKLDTNAEDLTERFFRGDVSRSTEGSGLGLSIAKTLVKAQGGLFTLEIDGDMFKAIIRFPQYKNEDPKREDMKEEV